MSQILKYNNFVQFYRLLNYNFYKHLSCRQLKVANPTRLPTNSIGLSTLSTLHRFDEFDSLINKYICSRPQNILQIYPKNTNANSKLQYRFISSDPKNSANVNQEKKRRIGSLSASLVENSSSSIKPYLKLMRVDQPIGTWLLFWPCSWSIAMAAAPGCLPLLDILALFAAGAFVMRGAGCTINDMWDKDIDSKVERTKSRPLVSGAMSRFDALVFLSGQLGVGLMILLQLNWYCFQLGFCSLGLVILYPLMKRVTNWPQLVLGMTFNWGALMGWAAAQGSCDWSVCLPLYAAGICWTIVYDTIYAHQDKIDDMKLNIKSTAIMFGENTVPVLSLFSGAMVSSLVLCGVQTAQTWPYYCSVAVIAAHLANQLYTLKINSPSDCGQKFISNQRVGLFLFLGIILSTLLKEKPAIDDKPLVEQPQLDDKTSLDR